MNQASTRNPKQRTRKPRPSYARRSGVTVWEEHPGRAHEELQELLGEGADDCRAQRPEVVVPVDFAPGSHAAVRHAARLARQDRAHLHLVHVFDVPPAMASQGSEGIQALLAVEQHAKTRLAALARSVEADADIEFQLGDPPAVIARRADELDADRIVMGSRRKAGPGRMGSVAREVRRRAGCPVTLITAGSSAA